MIYLRVISIFLFISIISLSCSNKLIGTWQVDRVLAHTDEVTPQARWVKFEKKNYQESGNGWQKHSYGSYTFKKHILTVLNDNGPEDEFEPFTVKIKKKTMEWERREDGRRIKVMLSKIEEIPMSNRDKLIGIWDLERVVEGQKEMLKEYDPNYNRYVYISWDNVFTIRNTPTGAHRGFYRVHSHRNEIEVFYTSDENKREVWQYELKDDKLILSSTNKEPQVIKEYKRVNKFL